MARNDKTQSGPFQEIQNLCIDAIRLSLTHLKIYSEEALGNLSSELVATILERLDKIEIQDMEHYIRKAAKNLVTNYAQKVKKNQTSEISDAIQLESDILTGLDSLLGDEYQSIIVEQLKIIRSVIGDENYLMLEAHFRDGDSYKTIADRMGIPVHIVANHINRARIKCQTLKREGKIAY